MFPWKPLLQTQWLVAAHGRQSSFQFLPQWPMTYFFFFCLDAVWMKPAPQVSVCVRWWGCRLRSRGVPAEISFQVCVRGRSRARVFARLGWHHEVRGDTATGQHTTTIQKLIVIPNDQELLIFFIIYPREWHHCWDWSNDDRSAMLYRDGDSASGCPS